MDMHQPDTLDAGALDESMRAQAEVALACVLDYAPGASVALPIHAGVELVEQPRVIPVPGVPASCLGLLTWQGRQLPLIDLQRYLHAADGGGGITNFSHVLVVAYQTQAGRPIEYGALCAPFLIRMIQVTDGQQCQADSTNTILNTLSISWFQHQGRAIPVMDPARLFSRPPSC